MADDEVNQADIDDILNSPSKPPSKPSSKPSSKPPTPPSNNGGSNRGSKPATPPTPTKVATYEPLPGSIQDPEPNAPAFEDLQDKRPSTVLEIGSDGIAAMSSPQAPPARLPPLAGGSNDGDGLGGYRQNLDIEQMNMPEPRWPHGPRILMTDATINDLLNTLECPVCLDTCDSSPIYQCPEGHLLCQRCNQRLVDCPQCGHALVNSRNRTAEDLAVKLQILRGSTTGSSGQQKITICVSEPHKSKKGLFGGVVYTVMTRYYADQFNDYGVNSHFTVTRSYKDIQTLYYYLLFTYKKQGVIVPPPPPKANLGFKDKCSTIGTSNLVESAAFKSIDRKCVALDRYMKRLAKHPVVRKDAMFRSFIQDKEVSKTLKPIVGFKSAIDTFKSRINIFRAKVTVTETDVWFKTRQTQMSSLKKQMNEMQTTLQGMSKLKHRLHEQSDDFRRDLVLLLVGRSTVRENDFTHVIDQVVDAQRIMSTMYDEQAQADDHIVQIAGDYMQLIQSAQDVLARRRKVLMDFEKETKKASKKSKKQSKKSIEAGDGNSQTPIEETTSEKSDLDEIEKKFNTISQTVRRELEHFDFVMREEFEKAFGSYSDTYWSSLHKTKVLDISDTTPQPTHMLALTNEPNITYPTEEYEDVSAMDYHM